MNPLAPSSGTSSSWVVTPSSANASIKLVEAYQPPVLPDVVAAKHDGDVDTAALVEQIGRSRISNLQTAIDKIERELPVLRAKMGEGLAEADRLETAARDKAREARNRNNTNNILLALAGVPPVLVAAKFIIEGTQYASLDDAIAAASLKRTEARTKVASFDVAVLEAKVDLQELRTIQAHLEGALTTGASSVPQNARTVRLCSTGRCLERRQNLVANLTQQLQILEKLESRGIEITGEINQLIGELRGLLNTATQLLDKAQKEFFDIVQGLLSADPLKALTKIARGKVTGYIKQALQERGLTKEFADFLLKRVTEASGNASMPYPLLPAPATELGNAAASFTRNQDGSLSDVIMGGLSDDGVRATYEAIMANGGVELSTWTFGAHSTPPDYALDFWARTRELDLPGLQVADFQKIAEARAAAGQDLRPLLRVLQAFKVDPKEIVVNGSPLSNWITSVPPRDILLHALS